MKIATHIEKFRRLDEARGRFRADVDYELWIWTSMQACVNLLNAALHQAGVTEETDSFPTQVPGLYARPDRATGTLTDVVHGPGDVMHADDPILATSVPEAIAKASAALALIEGVREQYARGNEVFRPEAIPDWDRAYRICMSELSRVLGLPMPP